MKPLPFWLCMGIFSLGPSSAALNGYFLQWFTGALWGIGFIAFWVALIFRKRAFK